MVKDVGREDDLIIKSAKEVIRPCVPRHKIWRLKKDATNTILNTDVSKGPVRFQETWLWNDG